METDETKKRLEQSQTQPTVTDDPSKTKLEKALESSPKSDSSEVVTTYDKHGAITGTQVSQRVDREVMTSYGMIPLHLVLWRMAIPAIMSFFVLMLCAYKIIVVTDPQELRAVYWSTITGIIANWMPSPGTRLSDDMQPTVKKKDG